MPKEYICTTCGKVFKTPQTLRFHSKSHKDKTSPAPPNNPSPPSETMEVSPSTSAPLGLDFDIVDSVLKQTGFAKEVQGQIDGINAKLAGVGELLEQIVEQQTQLAESQKQVREFLDKAIPMIAQKMGMGGNTEQPTTQTPVPTVPGDKFLAYAQTFLRAMEATKETPSAQAPEEKAINTFLNSFKLAAEIQQNARRATVDEFKVVLDFLKGLGRGLVPTGETKPKRTPTSHLEPTEESEE